MRSVRSPPVIGEACFPEQQIFELELLLYKSSTHRKKLAVKQVPVIGEAYTPEQQIFELEIRLQSHKHLEALAKLHGAYLAYAFFPKIR
jgi:hypothetical protein